MHMSPVVIITALESGFGFLLTTTIFYLVLRNGRRYYHFLFAAILFICMIWDLGILTVMLRNDQVEQLDIIGRIAVLPCVFIPAFIFHFVNQYTEKPIKWAIILVWVVTGLIWIPIILGWFYQIEGYYSYHWGNIFKVVRTVFDPLIFIFWFGINLSACWLLYRSIKLTPSGLQRRHFIYILIGFLVVNLALVKVLVTLGIDLAFILPLGMFMNDAFVSIIGLAIIKDRLFDITVIVKKGTLYSILAALLIFIYSFVEHILVTFVGEKIGENSTALHLVAVAIGIAVLMPVKNRIEKGVEGYFAHRKLQF
jgi:hypothetical protein